VPSPPFSILGLDHVVLRCTDLDATLAFYRDTLGCPLERVVESIGLHQVRAGASLIDLLPVGSSLAGDGFPDHSAGNMHHFCIRIAPTRWQAVLDHLQGQGIQVGEPARRYGAEGYGESLYLQDPEGNSVELKAPPSRGG
jgi:glyoxylase I family protein